MFNPIDLLPMPNEELVIHISPVTSKRCGSTVQCAPAQWSCVYVLLIIIIITIPQSRTSYGVKRNLPLSLRIYIA